MHIQDEYGSLVPRLSSARFYRAAMEKILGKESLGTRLVYANASLLLNPGGLAMGLYVSLELSFSYYSISVTMVTKCLDIGMY